MLYKWHVLCILFTQAVNSNMLAYCVVKGCQGRNVIAEGYAENT